MWSSTTRTAPRITRTSCFSTAHGRRIERHNTANGVRNARRKRRLFTRSRTTRRFALAKRRSASVRPQVGRGTGEKLGPAMWPGQLRYSSPCWDIRRGSVVDPAHGFQRAAVLPRALRLCGRIGVLGAPCNALLGRLTSRGGSLFYA